MIVSTSMSILNSNNFTSFFLECVPLISFYCLMAVGSVSSEMLKTVMRKDIPALFLILVGKSLVLTVKYSVSGRFSCRHCVSSWGRFLSLLRVCITSECWILSNNFCTSIDMIICFSFYSLSMWWITNFWMLN